MKRNFRTLLSVLSIISILMLSIPVFAEEQPETNEKLLFMENVNHIASANTNAHDTQDRICEVLKKYVSHDMDGAYEIIDTFWETHCRSQNSNPESEYDALEEYLNANNVFIYSCEISKIENDRSVGSTDVQMNSVIIAYDQGNEDWIVTGGGYWINTNYLNDAPILLFGSANVGGMDAIGFALMNTSGTTPTLLSCSGYVHNGFGDSITLNNPANSNSSNGLVFQFQDYVEKIDPFDPAYMGYGFAAQGIYSLNFYQYDGRARSYYAHSWSNNYLSSIGVSQTGISVSWTNASYGWEVYNNSDTNF